MRILMLAFVIGFFSCVNEKKNNITVIKLEEKGTVESETDSSVEKVEDFFKKILKEEYRELSVDIVSEKSIPSHVSMFSSDGLIQIRTISNKNYPSKSKPTSYNHFLLYMIEFSNDKKAKQSFDELYNYISLSNQERSKLPKEKQNEIEIIQLRTKPGGFLFNRGNVIYSLVESCLSSPLGGKWQDYENEFLTCFNLKNEELTILNAYCGADGYRVEKRKF